MREIVRRHPFATFLLIAFGFTWPLAAGIRVSLLLPLLALFGLLLGAVVVVGCLEGRRGLRALGRRFALRAAHLPGTPEPTTAMPAAAARAAGRH